MGLNYTQSEYDRKLACGFNFFLSPKYVKLTEFSLLTKKPHSEAAARSYCFCNDSTADFTYYCSF